MPNDLKRFWTVITGLYALSIVATMALMFFAKPLDVELFGGKYTLSLHLFLSGVIVGYSMLSINIVRENEVAAKIFLGKPIQDVSAGIIFVPLFLCRLERMTSLTFQKEFPTEPQNLWFEESPPLEGKKPPIRITTGGDHTLDADGKPVDDPVDRRMTLEVSYFVRMRILSPSKFIRVVGSTENAFKQIEDTINPVIQREFAGRTPRRILADFANINKELESTVKKLVGQLESGGAHNRPWGVAVENLSLKAPDLGEKVNQSLRDVPAAVLKAQEEVAKARGEAESLKLIQTQTAAMRKLFLTKEAKGFEALMRALGADNADQAITILQTEQGRTALEKAGNVTIFGGGGVGNMYGLVQSLLQQNAKDSKAQQ